jgi:hypothetical protein
MPVNVLALEQTQSTAATADTMINLINYCTTHPEATLHYHASYMILNIHSDASYLPEREANSRAGGLLYTGINKDSNINSPMVQFWSLTQSSNMSCHQQQK